MAIDINKYNSFHVFRYNDLYYLFDIYNMICCEICKETYIGLKNKCINVINEKEQSDLQVLKNNNIFFTEVPTKILDESEVKTTYFSFAPISRCNLRCKYCFAKSGDNVKGNKIFSEKKIKKICEFVALEFKPNCENFRFDFVGGGEPLLDKTLLRSTISTLKTTFKEIGKNIEIWLCTNGTLLDSEIVRYLDDNHVRFGVSIDGPQNIHDNCRIYENGQGTYETIYKNIEMIKDDSSLSNTVKDIWGLCVLTSESDNYTNILNNYKNMNFSSVQMKFARLDKNHVLSLNANNIESFKTKIASLIDYAFNKASCGDLSYLLLFLNDNDHIGKIVRRIIIQKPFVYRCHAARNKISFDADGNVYPCDSFVGNEEFIIGDIYNGINKEKQEKFYQLSIFDREYCKKCWARFVCGGDCYHNSYLSSGSLETPNSLFCEITKEIIELAIVNIVDMQRINMESYSLLYKILTARDKVYKK